MSTQEKSTVVNQTGMFGAQVTRRHMLLRGAASVALMSVPSAVMALQPSPAPTPEKMADAQRQSTRETILAKDGTRIYFRDWGSGTPRVLSWLASKRRRLGRFSQIVVAGKP